jgi:hypothetical protein
MKYSHNKIIKINKKTNPSLKFKIISKAPDHKANLIKIYKKQKEVNIELMIKNSKIKQLKW